MSLHSSKLPPAPCFSFPPVAQACILQHQWPASMNALMEASMASMVGHINGQQTPQSQQKKPWHAPPNSVEAPQASQQKGTGVTRASAPCPVLLLLLLSLLQPSLLCCCRLPVRCPPSTCISNLTAEHTSLPCWPHSSMQRMLGKSSRSMGSNEHSVPSKARYSMHGALGSWHRVASLERKSQYRLATPCEEQSISTMQTTLNIDHARNTKDRSCEEH